MDNRIIKTFSFIDESGILAPRDNQKRNYYGIGLLKHTNPNSLIQKLHVVYENLCSALKKEETRVEFSFKSTTSSSISSDLQFLDMLLSDYDWEFDCLYFDTNDAYYNKPLSPVERWEMYVQYTKMLVGRNLWSREETILIADYQRKPKLSRKLFEFISLDIPKVYNVLQVESHGVLLVQAADLLLGGYLYSLDPELGDKEHNKVRISQKVMVIQKKVGNKKFNCWRVDWSKSSRIGRV